MGDGTKENPYTRADVLKLIEENGGKANGLDLSGKVFEKGIDLSGLDLSEIILRNAIMPEANFQRACLDFAKLEEALLFEADFQDCNLTDANLQGAKLWLSNLQGVRFLMTEISQSTDFMDVIWGNYILAEEKEGLFAQAVASYRRLKVWHKNAGISDIEGDFFYREKYCKRKQFWWGDNKTRRLKDSIHFFKIIKLSKAIIPKKPLHWALFTLYDILCGYGEKWERVIISAAAVISIAAFIYFLIGSVWEWSAFWLSLYFSTVSFTALGYGSWVNTTSDWIRGLGAAESVLGVFMMALFLVTFIRKMTR